MNRVLLSLSKLFLSLGAVLLVGGLASAQDTEMIVGGKPVPEGKFPWQVRLYQSMEDDKGFCGGTIIAPQWILTAGHCVVDDSDPENLKPLDMVVVGYGSVDRTTTKRVESEQVVVHPLYLEQGLAGGGDLALVKLKDPIPDAVPIETANSKSEEKLVTRGVKVTVSGWGAIWDPDDKEVVELLSKISPQDDIYEKLNFPLKLNEVDIHVMDREECRKVYEPLQFKIADSEICAMKPRSVANSCYGDSGGPLMVLAEDPKQHYVQIGVVSWGERCGRAGNPNVFARVAYFTDWLKETMGADAVAVSGADSESDTAPTGTMSPE